MDVEGLFQGDNCRGISDIQKILSAVRQQVPDGPIWLTINPSDRIAYIYIYMKNEDSWFWWWMAGAICSAAIFTGMILCSYFPPVPVKATAIPIISVTEAK